MRKRILLLAALFCAAIQTFADEGMWTLFNLPQAVFQQMKNEGYQLPYNSLYYSKNAIKNAVVNFGGYCTGVVVSPDGLLFTNHHCGFESIRSHSTVEHDYMLNGFYAKTFADELPNPDLFVAFMISQEDVTPKLKSMGLDHKTHYEKEKLINNLEQQLTDSVKKINKNYSVNIDPFYEGNKYYATTYEIFNDVRLVFTVPKSMGKYGGETDNWMWPRQTCDFSVFRIYADPKTNGPANYSKDNVPYRPATWAHISLDGYKEGDFAMTLGYPGSTSRYLSSYGIEKRYEDNAIRAQARGVKQEVMLKHMRANEAVRIKYDSKFAQSSNYWKNSIGMNKCIDSIGLIQQKQAYEQQIQHYMDSTGYFKDSLNFKTLKKLYDRLRVYNHDLRYLRESFVGTNELCKRVLKFTGNNLTNIPNAEIGYTKNKKKMYLIYKDNEQTWDADLDKEVFAVALKNYKEHVLDTMQVPGFYRIIEKKYHNNYMAFVNDLWKKSIFMKPNAKITYGSKKVQNDLGYIIGLQLNDIMKFDLICMMSAQDSINTLEKYLCAAKIRMEEDMPHYSDANFTMRLSYGQVGGFDLGGTPSGYYTTAASMVQKMKKGDKGQIDYVAEPIMHQLMSAKDFGRYADKKDNMLHLCLLTNNDITGGNSGSPLFDGKGRLIGLAFDGNWDSLSSDINFDKHLARTISVDMRYVLYMMDKWGHADRLVKEMNAE